MSFNIPQMMKKAREMQTRMQEMQQRVALMEVQGTAGGGAVHVVMTCKGEVREIKIDPSVVNPAEKDMLEDLLKAALNAARAAADAKVAEETRKVMDELGLPANAQLPF